MLQGTTLVVVADGAVGRFLQRQQPGARLIERTDLTMAALPAEPVRDHAPRVQDSFGNARHAIESRMTPHEAAEAKFLTDVAVRIQSIVQDAEPQCVALCAPPRALGRLRTLLTHVLDGRTVVSLDKDITKEAVDRIDARIQDLNA